MQSSDIESILRINSATAPMAILWTREMYAEALSTNAPGRVWVAVQQGQVVGFLCFRVVHREIQIANLAVDPAHWRQGAASALIQNTWERFGDADEMLLEVRASNAAATAFYQRLGFVEERRRRNFYANPPEDAIVLVRKRRQPSHPIETAGG